MYVCRKLCVEVYENTKRVGSVNEHRVLVVDVPQLSTCKCKANGQGVCLMAVVFWRRWASFWCKIAAFGHTMPATHFRVFHVSREAQVAF